jgi:hypothetical protein
MATPQLSPGVLVREVDLTVGRADNVLDNIGAIAGPFAIGPVEEAIDITTEQELINTFGKPLSTDTQYEYWMSAASYLSYGGILKVARVDGLTLNNANAGVGYASTTVAKIKNYDNYNTNWSGDNLEFVFASKNPGSWANNLKVCLIDDKADQTIGINTTNLEGIGAIVGYGLTTTLSSVSIPGNGTVSNFNGYIKGIITGVSTDAVNGNSTVDVKILSRVSTSGVETPISYAQGNINASIESADSVYFINNVGAASTTTLDNLTTTISSTVAVGSTEIFVGSVSDVQSGDVIAITGTGTTLSAGVPIVSVGGTFVTIGAANTIADPISSGSDTVISERTGAATYAATSAVDWYDQQTLNLTNSTVYWKSIAPKPISNNYSLERNGKNDAIHIAIVDDTGSVTGIQGNILEKHLGVSKALDSVSSVNSPQKIWYKNYLADFSSYVYAGNNPSDFADSYWGTTPVATGFSTAWTPNTLSQGLWGQNAQGVTYNAIGNITYNLAGGVDYSSSGGMVAQLSYIVTAYGLFSNKDEIEVDYLINGPSLSSEYESQAKANYLISIANDRKDCVAVISPYRSGVVDVTNSNTQTDNIIRFFSSLSSSSYAVFDSGYKYTYDRFNNLFRYIPCNADIAGLMCRTNLVAYPWFSPAGQQRGIVNNAVKLAYNPSKAQRDELYTARVNSVVNQPGIGILLFGDKTALGYASAFDRINVRRLFLTVEQALERTAQAQLFELNDQITRANFVNIVEPYLRDIQAKRGLYDFLVICDESNNTPDVIDNNEFRADIFLKPTKSINYVTLTFVATRTGVSFEEVAGRV